MSRLSRVSTGWPDERPDEKRDPRAWSATYLDRDGRAASPTRADADAGRRNRALPAGRPGGGLPAPRRRRLRPGPAPPRERVARGGGHCKRSSSGSGTIPIASSPDEGHCAPTCSPRPMAGRSTCCARKVPVVDARSARLARTAEGGYDLEHEVWDLADGGAGARGGLVAARRRAEGDRARVLRRPHLP